LQRIVLEIRTKNPIFGPGPEVADFQFLREIVVRILDPWLAIANPIVLIPFLDRYYRYS